MKKALLILLTSLTIIGCGKGNQGELIGVKQKKFYEIKPHGMSLIPGGSFIMGSSDEDILAANDNITRTVTVRSFWMDETEITNAEYKQFVEWVKDSIIRTELAKAALLNGEGYLSVSEFPTTDEEIDENPILAYLPLYDMDALENADDDEKSGYQQYLEEKDSDYVFNYYETEELPDDEFHFHLPLNRDVDIIKEREDYPDLEYARVFEETIYLPESEWFNGEPALDTKLLKYRFASVDLNGAVENPDSVEKYTTYQAPLIYPDTTVWIKDFKYSYNEPMHNDYFWHRAYAKYPVVGISWHQARAFSHWRTKIRNDYLRSRKKRKSTVGRFRLPTEMEWEYAARGGLESGIYPWGGPYLTDDRGCFMANFKPKRGDYATDSALYTVEADSFEPNDYGLYNMSGNVSEWTSSTYTKDTYEFMTTINPNYDNFRDTQKVIRGGSWKDVAYYLRVASRDYEYAESARSYLGFRLVRDYLGANEVQQQ